jgi:hypothetical protein
MITRRACPARTPVSTVSGPLLVLDDSLRPLAVSFGFALLLFEVALSLRPLTLLLALLIFQFALRLLALKLRQVLPLLQFALDSALIHLGRRWFRRFVHPRSMPHRKRNRGSSTSGIRPTSRIHWSRARGIHRSPRVDHIHGSSDELCFGIS